VDHYFDVGQITIYGGIWKDCNPYFIQNWGSSASLTVELKNSSFIQVTSGNNYLIFFNSS
jgi:hypothetical protein